jgi:soluble lytic murein transglycosylase
MGIDDLLASVMNGNPVAESSPVSDSATPIDPIVNKYATQFGVDPALVKAVINRESSGDSSAVSPAGALGTMQIMPSTGRGIAKELGDTFDRSKLMDADTNIKYGTYLLSTLLAKHGGNEAQALAEYHGGGKAVMPDGSINPNASDGLSKTTDYVDSILKSKGGSSQGSIDDLLASVMGKPADVQIEQQSSTPLSGQSSAPLSEQSQPIQSDQPQQPAAPTFFGGGQPAGGASGSFDTPKSTLMDKVNTVADAALKGTGKSIADLADAVFTPVQNAFAGLTGNETIAPNTTPMQGVKENLALAPDEQKQLDDMGLPGKIAVGATELLLQAPLFAGAGAAGQTAIRALVSKIPVGDIAEILPAISKINPGIFKTVQEAAGDMLGMGGYSAAEESGAGGTPEEVAKAGEQGGIMGLAGRIFGSAGKAIPEAAPGVVKKAAEMAASGAGFGAGTAATGGSPEEIASNTVLGAAMGAIHPSERSGATRIDEATGQPVENKPVEMPETKSIDDLANQIFGKEDVNGQEMQGRQEGQIVPQGSVSETAAPASVSPEEFSKLAPDQQAEQYAQLFQKHQDAVETSQTDPLTGLKNRQYLKDNNVDLNSTPMVMLDIDNFKKGVNDAYGHPTGDEVLKTAAKTLQDEIGNSGTVVRLGGEEIGVFPLTSTPIDGILNSINKARETLSNTSFADGKLKGVTFSAGYGNNATEADDAVYSAKDNGKGRTLLNGEVYGRPIEPTPISGQTQDEIRLRGPAENGTPNTAATETSVNSSRKINGAAETTQPQEQSLLNTPEYGREKFLSDLHSQLYNDLKNGWTDRNGTDHPGSYPGWLNDYNLLTERKDLTGKTKYDAQGARIQPSPEANKYLQNVVDSYGENEKSHIPLAEIGLDVPQHLDDVRAWLEDSRHPTKNSGATDSFKNWEAKYIDGQKTAQENQQTGVDEETADYWRAQEEKRAQLLKETGYPPEWNASTGKFAARTVGQTDLFGKDKSLAQIEQERTAGLQRGEIQNRLAQTRGGSADPNLPMFRGTGAVEGEQSDLFGGSANASVGKYADRQVNPALVETPELVEMAKQLSGKDPAVKSALRAMNGAAAGTFQPGTKQIDLRADLFAEPEQAAKTLSHEIGHLVDYLPDNTMAKGNILGRIATLHKYLKNSLDAEPRSEGLFTNENKIYKPEITNELKGITQVWKPFDESASPKYTKYRYSPKELYADAFSVLLNEPKLLEEKAPKFYNSLFAYMDRKPEVKQLYDDIQGRIGQGSDAVLKNREGNLLSAYQVGENKFRDSQLAAEKKKTGFMENLKQLLWDADRPLSNAMKGKTINPERNPLTQVRETRYQGSEINNLLDNVGTRVLRPLYDSGLNENDLGLYMQNRRASTERASLANPGGVGEKFATQQLDYLKRRVGPEKYSQIEKAADKYWKVRNELIIPKLEASGMYSKELMDKIKDNKNYATFQVLDHLQKEGGGGRAGVPGSIKRQIGTLKDIANPFTSTVLKDSILLRAAQKNDLVKSTVDMLGTTAKPSETRWVNDHMEAIEQSRGSDLKTVRYYENGKVKSFDIDRDIADVIDKEPSKANPAIAAITVPARILKSVFVQYNPFWIARNIPRDFLNTWKNFDRATVKNMLGYYAKVLPDAYREVFNGESSPLLQQMKKEKAFFTGRNWNANDMADAETELDRRLISFGKDPSLYKKEVVTPFNGFMNNLKKYGSIENWGKVSEVVGKAAGFKMVQEQYPNIGPRERAEQVRRRVGTPDFLTGGRARLIYNNLWLFSNVNKEGWRGAFESYKKNPANFIVKTAIADIAPTIMTKALELGLLAGVGGAVGQYFKDYADKLKKVSENDKTNYNCVVAGSTESGKTVYLVIPKDQNAAIISGTLRKLLNLAQGKNPNGLRDALTFAMGASPTGNINPLFEQLFNWNDFLMGTGHPRNFYTGKEILTQQEQTAGGWYAWKKMLEASLSDMGSSVWFKFPDDKVQLESAFEKAYGIPVAGRALNTFIRVSDYGTSENLRSEGSTAARDKARMSLDVKDMIVQSLKDGGEQGRPEARRLFKDAQDKGYTSPFTRFWQTYQAQAIKVTASPETRAINSASTTEEKNAIIEKILDDRGITGEDRQKEKINLKRSARMLKGASQ